MSVITTIQLLKDDITKMAVDAIVNAAKTSLMGGGGVDGAIHRAGGPAILEACRQIVNRQGGCAVGDAVITTAGKLPAKYVIHTVGPVWNEGKNNEPQLLASCYRRSLSLAVENNLVSVAFPNISTGIYRFPKKEAATIAISEVQKFITVNRELQKILFVCFDEENYSLYRELLNMEH